jgi:hypothetical protein
MPALLILLILQESSAFQAPPLCPGSHNINVKRRHSPLAGAQRSETPEGPEKKNTGLLRLAELSLKDYDWRSSVFKTKEADRKVEESLARIMGDEPIYVRPMDASEEKIGPLVSTWLVWSHVRSLLGSYKGFSGSAGPLGKEFGPMVARCYRGRGYQSQKDCRNGRYDGATD